jgi:hypothetical protein
VAVAPVAFPFLLREISVSKLVSKLGYSNQSYGESEDLTQGTILLQVIVFFLSPST